MLLKRVYRLPVARLVLTLVACAIGAVGAVTPPGSAQGQEPPVQIIVSSMQPTQVTRGAGGTLSIFGSNFTASTAVSLVGVGQLSVTLIDGGTLQAALPTSLNAGQYGVEVTDPTGEVVYQSGVLSLSVVEPATATPTQPPPISVTRTEPSAITRGQSGVLSVFGANFTTATTVRLIGVGLLPTTFVNSATLTATLPDALAVGQYSIEVSDPAGGTAVSPNTLAVLPPPPTPPPTPEPLPSLPPPTPVPGRPALLVRSFSANPPTIRPGDTVRFTFEVVNLGTRAAQGVSVALDSGSRFVPANGQASVTLPDLGLGAAYTAALTVVAGTEAPGGPVNVPIVLSYSDFLGDAYTSKADLSVTVQATVLASQVILDSYEIDPKPAQPGQEINLTVTVANIGNQAASQVLLRVSGAESALLAGQQGDTLSFGNIQPGAKATLSLPLVVSAAAKPGPQAQPVTITYLQAGESQQVSASVTVDVAPAEVAEALLLLKSYDIGKEVLHPGERFTLTMALQNVGEGEARNLLVTFGTVESSTGGGTGAPPGEGSQTSTSPSTVFAPLGTGGRLFVGLIGPDGETIEVTQNFIVNGSVNSGIYSLPITLRYLSTDGKSVQESLTASLLVVVPPRLQVNLQGLFPEMVNVGEPLPVNLLIYNAGKANVNLTGLTVEAENGEVVEGAETSLNTLRSEEDIGANALVLPQEEGPVNVTVTLRYLDDLNREGTLVSTYQTQAMPPPPPIDPFPPDVGPPPTEDPKRDDIIGRLLLGLLGLGS